MLLTSFWISKMPLTWVNILLILKSNLMVWKISWKMLFYHMKIFFVFWTNLNTKVSEITNRTVDRIVKRSSGLFSQIHLIFFNDDPCSVQDEYRSMNYVFKCICNVFGPCQNFSFYKKFQQFLVPKKFSIITVDPWL